MGDTEPSTVTAHHRSRWLKYALVVLLAEKTIQHIAVSVAFYFNWTGIGASVAVSPRVLIVLGVTVAILFALALWALVTERPWASALVIALALFDIIGEFVVQATLAIAITVSFVVALLLLVLGLMYRRREASPS